LGAKWRFLNRDNLQLAVAPGYAFGISAGAAKRGIADDEDIFYLPLELGYTLGNWGFNAELGYASIKNDPDGWGYGAAVSHPLGDRIEIMFELYGGSDDSFDNDNLNFHVGLDFAWTDSLNLLFAIGSGLREPSGSEELDLDLFLGLQFVR
jgi:outer membrane receptor protein involved in Fe transport